MTFRTKVMLSFLTIPLFLGLLLFVPAWSLDFWEAWVYSASWGATMLLMCVYMLRKDPHLLQRRFTTKEPRRKQAVLVAILRLAFTAPLITAGFDHRLGWSHVPVAIEVAAQGLLLLGLLIILETIRENTFAATIIAVEPGQRVISTGLYRHVRHPMYAGAMLAQFVTAIALGSWWAMLPFVPGLAVVVLRLLDEERLLSSSLPGYNEYRAATRYRLIPRIW